MTTTRITIAEAAERYGVSTRTIRRYIANGLLPAYRMGPRLVRIEEADLDRIEQRMPTTGESS